jgi:hypothetical protein
MKLRIVTVNGGPLTSRHALLRESPSCARLLVTTVAGLSAVLSVGPEAFAGLPVGEQLALRESASPAWLGVWSTAFSLFGIADIVAFLRTEHRRSMRDILAGTVVILRAPATIAVPEHLPPARSTSMFQ